MQSLPCQRGLTHVETLVAGCLTVLAVGLLLPALTRVQAAARGNECVLNLRAIANAALNYDSTHGHLPPGMDRQYVGTLIYLLPYLESDLLYRNFSFDPQYGLYWHNPHNRPATDGTDKIPRPPDVYGCEWEVRFLLCPEGPPPEDTVTALMAVRYGTTGTDYRADDGLIDGHLFSGSPGRLIMARSHYLGIGGDWRTEPPYNGIYRGIFTYNSRVSIAQLTSEDGASNTLAFAETWGGYGPWKGTSGIPSGWTVASRSAGFNYSTFGTCPDPANLNCDFKSSFGLSMVAFGAFHGAKYNRFNVAFADGSVRSLPGDFDFNIWTAMCGYRDGMIRPRGLEPDLGWAYSD